MVVSHGGLSWWSVMVSLMVVYHSGLSCWLAECPVVWGILRPANSELVLQALGGMSTSIHFCECGIQHILT